MSDFAAGIELDEPRECGVDEWVVGGATGEEEVGVGGEVEAACFAIAFGELHEELAFIFVAEAFEHLVDLRTPGSIALRSLEQLLQSSATRSKAAEIVEILHGQIGLRATGFRAVGERDAAENAAGARRCGVD